MRNLKILIVDSNAEVADSLANLLSFWGHEARVTYDGERALVEASSFSPDFVLADATLADSYGPEFAAGLVTVCGDARPPLLAVMWPARHASDARCAADFHCDYSFNKPLNLTFLNKVLQFLRDRPESPSVPFPRKDRTEVAREGNTAPTVNPTA